MTLHITREVPFPVIWAVWKVKIFPLRSVPTDGDTLPALISPPSPVSLSICSSTYYVRGKKHSLTCWCLRMLHIQNENRTNDRVDRRPVDVLKNNIRDNLTMCMQYSERYKIFDHA